MKKKSSPKTVYEKYRPPAFSTKKIPAVPVFRRDSHDELPSVTTNKVFIIEQKEQLAYTGNKLIGISVLHKSCLQPIFSQEEAIDSAHMRRN